VQCFLFLFSKILNPKLDEIKAQKLANLVEFAVRNPKKMKKKSQFLFWKNKKIARKEKH
jgi:hypothetical protein